jgi:hypothetical protein
MIVFESYKEAVEYVSSSYWVEVVTFPPGKEAHDRVFSRDYLVTDESESGFVHYSKK